MSAKTADIADISVCYGADCCFFDTGGKGRGDLQALIDDGDFISCHLEVKRKTTWVSFIV
jgi:hypothetical protein